MTQRTKILKRSKTPNVWVRGTSGSFLSTFDFEVLNVHLTFSLFRGVGMKMQWGLKTSTNQLQSKRHYVHYIRLYINIYTPVCIYVYIYTHKCILFMLKVCVCVSVCVYTFVIHKKFVTYCQKYQFVVVIKGKQKSHSKPLARIVINLAFKIGAGRGAARWRGERGETGVLRRRRCRPGLLSVLVGKEGDWCFTKS